jgi:hypothetical protein
MEGGRDKGSNLWGGSGVLSDKCEPVSEWPVTVALCRTELAPLGESSGAVKLEIGP